MSARRLTHSPRTFVVRVYRLAGGRIAGQVEDVLAKKIHSFTSVDELWTAIARPRPRQSREAKNDERSPSK